MLNHGLALILCFRILMCKCIPYFVLYDIVWIWLKQHHQSKIIWIFPPSWKQRCDRGSLNKQCIIENCTIFLTIKYNNLRKLVWWSFHETCVMFIDGWKRLKKFNTYRNLSNCTTRVVFIEGLETNKSLLAFSSFLKTLLSSRKREADEEVEM